MILSAVEMLEFLGEGAAAAKLRQAVHACLAAPATRTRDLGGTLDLDRYTDAVIEHLG
jgi:tartrate dehydrogenase/decarboxylase/D-malate dehydrogenase